MRKAFEHILSLRPAGGLRRLGQRLKGSNHLLLLTALCLCVLAAVGKLSMAGAVNSEGEPSFPAEASAMAAMAVPAPAEAELREPPVLRELTVVYADGTALCAYESAAEAAAALEALCDSYWIEGLESMGFREDVALGRALAEESLLEDAEAKLTEGLTVETVGTVVNTSVIPYSTHEIVDQRLYEEEGFLATPGENGLEQVVSLARYENGILAEIEELSRTCQDPVTEITVVGGRKHRSEGNYIWPVEQGWLSSPFGRRSGEIGSSDHKGVDIAGEWGSPIMASDGGVVFFAETYFGYGLMVKIQHENGDVTYYAHCSELLVEEGDAVAQGDVIARMGASGVASGTHCHFELHPGGGDAADPMDYLPDCPYPWL